MLLDHDMQLRSDRRRSWNAHLRSLVRENALSLVLMVLFGLSVLGQMWFGLSAYNEEQLQRGESAVSLSEYLGRGHFLEALFENWESEFLQMGIFVWLSARLSQKGSAESRPLDESVESDEDPRAHHGDADAPWPVRQGGVWLWIYERSLAFTFALLFLASFVLHAWGGVRLENEERVALGLAEQELRDFVLSSQFWFESFQNWQSEFLSMFAIVVFTIFLRQRGSPQSKPVAAPHSETGS